MKKIVLLAMFALLSMPSAKAVSDKSFKDSWAPEGRSSWGGCSVIVDPPDVRCINHVIFRFEPKCLTRDHDIALEVEVDKKGIPSYTIVEDTASDKELFYGEQAVWDGAPLDSWAVGMKFRFVFPHYNPNSEQNNIENYVKAYGPLTDAVVMQIIPTQAEFRSHGFGTLEMHATNNLVTVPVKNLNSKLLSDFRLDWVHFLIDNPKADRNSIIEEGALLLDKYAPLFKN